MITIGKFVLMTKRELETKVTAAELKAHKEEAVYWESAVRDMRARLKTPTTEEETDEERAAREAKLAKVFVTSVTGCGVNPDTAFMQWMNRMRW